MGVNPFLPYSLGQTAGASLAAGPEAGEGDLLRPPPAAPAPRSIASTGNSANRVDIIFLGDGYKSSEITVTYTNHILNYLSYLFDDSSLTQPFGRYENFFNIHAIDVVSNQSGADDPLAGIARDTALDASYNWDGMTDRLLYIDETKANTAMDTALSGTGIAAEMRYVLVNDSKYGGGGGSFGVYSAGNGDAREIALHEIGHSFAGLADEYGGNVGTYTGTEPGPINVTKNSSGAKWAEWLGYIDPVLGTVGAYEGGFYYDHGVYRPTVDSKMRSLGNPFDPIAREEFVHRFYQFVDPLDGYDSNAGTRSNVQTLSVDTVDPAVIHIDWTVNGQVFVDVGETFSLVGHGFGNGVYTVTARAYDPTDWVRGDRSDLEQTVTWTIDNTNVGGDQTGSTLTLQPGSEGQDLWITDTFSFGDNYGVDNEELRVGGWGDHYNSLIRFDLTQPGLPSIVTSATLRLYSTGPGSAETSTGMLVERLNTAWSESYGWHDYPLSATNIGTTRAPGVGWSTSTSRARSTAGSRTRRATLALSCGRSSSTTTSTAS